MRVRVGPSLSVSVGEDALGFASECTCVSGVRQGGRGEPVGSRREPPSVAGSRPSLGPRVPQFLRHCHLPVPAALDCLKPPRFLVPGPPPLSAATMMDVSELGESARYLRQGYQEMMKVHTVAWDGKCRQRAQPQRSLYGRRAEVGRGNAELRGAGLTASALDPSLRVWGPEAKFYAHHCVCEQASVCSSVKWEWQPVARA